MKNTFLSLCLIMTLVLSLVACGSNRETPKESDAIGATVLTETVEEAKEAKKTERERSELLSGTFKIPLQEIYVDTPPYIAIEKGYTEIYKDSDSKYITFNYLEGYETADAKSAFDAVYPKFKINISNQHGITTDDFTTRELVEINGIEAYKVSGNVGGGIVVIRDCYFYGYSFVYGGFACGIFGVVTDWDQPAEQIESVTAMVDAMMASVRSEP